MPAGLRRAAVLVMFAGEPEIADRDRTHAGLRRAVAIREGVELLHIAQWMVRLALHPGAQAGLQRTVLGRKRPRWQRATVLRGKHARLAFGDREQHRHQIGLNQMLSGDVHRWMVAVSKWMKAMRNEFIRCFGTPHPRRLTASAADCRCAPASR
ncbi:hypothetical protein SDC9_167626 [bioreactor metagenome]|uniref:Uncharacterized protein n=1 Tax=bioreactor metagenome TaxID=1076179 RepID=A0A645G096_9ZZZZ